MDKTTLLVAHSDSASALALRVAELSTVLKQQREQIEEQKSVLDLNRTKAREHEEIIRMQEAQLLERDAQLQAQSAEIRALRRQHALDAEALRTAQAQLQPRHRLGGPMGKLKDDGVSPKKLATSSPSTSSTMKQLQQALADKLVLVRALHQLTSEMATARAEARQYAAVSERSLSTAWRLGQLGQLGLALLDMGDGREGGGEEAYAHDSGQWAELLNATQASPPALRDALGTTPAMRVEDVSWGSQSQSIGQ